MPPKKRDRNGQRTSLPAAGGDRLGALPDDVLRLVLSFLPTEDVVRTCILARRWRHLLKSARSLRIVRNLEDQQSVKAVREFVDHLLLLRRDSPLHTFELSLNFMDLEDEMLDDMSHIKLWIRHVLKRKVQVLSLQIKREREGFFAELNRLTLISKHLRKLHLSNIYLEYKFLNFSCCPVLEVLEADACDFTDASSTILSRSLKCLSINSDCIFYEAYRIYIETPNLHSLRLEVASNRTPVLTNYMSFLMEAFVELSDGCCDYCPYNVSSGDCEEEACDGCYRADADTYYSALLDGLSEARSLVLLSNIETYVFRWDLKRCPVFGNLRTLLLSEYWCCPSVDAEFCALKYMLEHSPVLEKLTLEIYCTGPKSELTILKGIPDPTARSDIMSEHLQTVEVKCKSVDDNMLVLKFLSALGICFRF